MNNPVDKPIIWVWDSMMGDGKTTQAIAQINSNPELRYIIIVRYITEIERIKRECKAANLVEPTEQKHAGKTASFHELLQEGKSIVMTHELYRRLSITEREKKLIREYEYRLYMDETADVIEPLNITSHDLKEIFDRYVEVDDCGLVKWKTKDYKGNHALIKRQIESKAVIFWNNSILLWLLPIDLIESFCEITIMTFMFEASHMKAYLDIHCLEYEIWHINNRELVKGRQGQALPRNNEATSRRFTQNMRHYQR